MTRYVLHQLAVGMIFVTAGLTCMLWLTQSLRFVEMIVNRGLSPGLFLYMTMLLLPNFLTIVLPIALFAVVMFTYSKMINDRELVVMRANGLSQLALAAPALVLAVIVVILSYALNLWFLPKSYEKFREIQWDVRHSYSHVLLQEGAFNVIGSDVTVYVRERTRDGELLGVLIHDAREARKPATLMAARGAMVQTDEGSRVVMFDGNRQVVERETNRLSILYFDRYTFDLEATQKTAPERFRDSRERLVHELLNVESDDTVLPRSKGKFIVEGHKRLTTPLDGLTYVLVALAALLSGGFTRRSQPHRIVAAVVAVVALQGTSLGIGTLAAKQLSLVWLIYLDAVIPMVVAAYLMLRTKPWRRSRADALPADLASTGLTSDGAA